MSFEAKKPKDSFEVANQISKLIENLSIDELERGIRALPANVRERFLRAVETSKTSSSPL